MSRYRLYWEPLNLETWFFMFFIFCPFYFFTCIFLCSLFQKVLMLRYWLSRSFPFFFFPLFLFVLYLRSFPQLYFPACLLNILGSLISLLRALFILSFSFLCSILYSSYKYTSNLPEDTDLKVILSMFTLFPLEFVVFFKSPNSSWLFSYMLLPWCSPSTPRCPKTGDS